MMHTATYYECETNAATALGFWTSGGGDEDDHAQIKETSTSRAVTLAVLLGLCNYGPAYGTTHRFAGESYGITRAGQAAEWGALTRNDGDTASSFTGEGYGSRTTDWEALTQNGGSTVPPTLTGGSVMKGTLSKISGDLADDIESRRSVRKVIQKYGEPSIHAIDDWIKLNPGKQTMAADIMRLLGEIDDPATKSARLDLLGRGLKSSSPVIRDSSALGLEDIGDTRSIQLLESAIEHEPYETLRRDYRMIVDSLKA